MEECMHAEGPLLKPSAAKVSQLESAVKKLCLRKPTELLSDRVDLINGLVSVSIRHIPMSM